jgi:hypothetical protein
MIIAFGLYYILYTDSGHARISSYMSTKISKEIGRDVSIKVQKMSLSPTHLDSTIMIEDKVEAKIAGFRSLLGSYDVSYELRGEGIEIDGTIEGDEEDFTLSGKGFLMDGDVDFSWHHTKQKEEDIMIDAKQVDAAKLMQFLEQKPLFAGKFSLKGDIPLYTEYEKEGEVRLQLHRGGLYLKNIDERFGIRFPDDFMGLANINVVLEKSAHTFAGNIQSSIGDVHFSKGSFIEVNKKLNVRYSVEIEELSKLSFLTKKRYGGAFEAEGEIEYLDGALRFDGKSHSLDGLLSYYFDKGKLEAKLRKASLSKVFRMMHYPSIMRGTVNSNIDYDTHDKIAVINMESLDASFANSSAVKKIKSASGVDLSKEIFQKTYFAASVQDGIVSYDFKAQNKKGFLSLSDAKMDAQKNTIQTHFDMQIQEQEFSGEIYGSLKSPKVKLDIAKFIEFKAKKEIDAFFGTGTSDKVKEKLEGVDAKKVKGFLKSFF